MTDLGAVPDGAVWVSMGVIGMWLVPGQAIVIENRDGEAIAHRVERDGERRPGEPWQKECR